MGPIGPHKGPSGPVRAQLGKKIFDGAVGVFWVFLDVLFGLKNDECCKK